MLAIVRGTFIITLIYTKVQTFRWLVYHPHQMHVHDTFRSVQNHIIYFFFLRFQRHFFLFISSFAEMKFRFQLILFSSFIKISLLPAYNTLALISIVSSGFFGCGSCFVIIYLLMVCHISFDFNPFQTPKIAFIFHFRCQNFLLLV